jgi:hypothetical protein
MASAGALGICAKTTDDQPMAPAFASTQFATSLAAGQSAEKSCRPPTCQARASAPKPISRRTIR